MAKKKATETEAPEKVKPVKDEQNGIVRPKAGTATGRVWEIADELSAKAGAPTPRKDVLEAAQKEDINVSTAATQYGRWRKYHGLAAEKKEAKPKAAPKAKKGKEESDVTTEEA
jgi:hypothetical protein